MAQPVHVPAVSFGELTGTKTGSRTGGGAQSARTPPAACGGIQVLGKFHLRYRDPLVAQRQVPMDETVHSCRSSTRLSTPLLAQRQIWSAFSRKPASPMFVAALFVEALLVVVMSTHSRYGVRGTGSFQLCRLRQVPAGQTVRKPVEIPQLQFLARLFTCPLLFHRQVLMVPTVQNTVEDPAVFPQVQILDKVVDLPVVVRRQVPMVLTVLRPVEIPQVYFLDKAVDMLVCCATTGAHGLNCAENRSGSAVLQFIDKFDDILVVSQRLIPIARERSRAFQGN